ncbi:uncharacterized protein [Amphiura filiformis]|uniref:uncharacterized protein n=1 Tax=Amphiura filiformis TaxID=82378 RepID=UPI003B20E0DB
MMKLVNVRLCSCNCNNNRVGRSLTIHTGVLVVNLWYLDTVAAVDEGEADMAYRMLGESNHVGRGSRYDYQDLLDREMLVELRQRVLSGQSDATTIHMLAQLGGELRAKVASQVNQGSSSSVASTPWDPGAASSASGTELLQSQQEQDFAQHQQQQYDSGTFQASQTGRAQLQSGARIQSGVEQARMSDIPTSAVNQQLGAAFQSDQTVLFGNLQQQQQAHLLRQQQAQLERQLLVQQQAQLRGQDQKQLQAQLQTTGPSSSSTLFTSPDQESRSQKRQYEENLEGSRGKETSNKRRREDSKEKASARSKYYLGGLDDRIV